MRSFIGPGATLGVVGGGQLGRMFALAARNMGYRVHVLVPEADSPTGQVADRVFRAPYSDLEQVEAFARSVDAVTYEFENIPVETLEMAARHAPLHPGSNLLAASQERAREKAALVGLGLPVADHAVLEEAGDLLRAEEVGFPGVLKTAAWGYDGKGQVRVAAAGELERAWDRLGRERCVYEALVPFVEELSVVAARDSSGSCAFYGPFLNQHENHILDLTSFPAPVEPITTETSREIARAILEGFEVNGVMCVELFLLEGGRLVVNEVAPRPHNSGHVTIDTHRTSQFEQQVRALCGLPLGDVEPLGPAGAMANLLGDLWEPGPPTWDRVLEDGGIRLHLYGKHEPRPGRKMGHLACLGADRAAAEARVRAARSRLQADRGS